MNIGDYLRSNFSTDEIRQMVVDYKQLERDGYIGDCALRTAVEQYFDHIGYIGDCTLRTAVKQYFNHIGYKHVGGYLMFMNQFAFEAYRFFADLYFLIRMKDEK